VGYRLVAKVRLSRQVVEVAVRPSVPPVWMHILSVIPFAPLLQRAPRLGVATKRLFAPVLAQPSQRGGRPPMPERARADAKPLWQAFLRLHPSGQAVPCGSKITVTPSPNLINTRKVADGPLRAPDIHAPAILCDGVTDAESAILHAPPTDVYGDAGQGGGSWRWVGYPHRDA
jgi:hypothetical protein